ncbi:hypothetical protein [Streptomyces griseus]|uniref:hypothetical protein n=1 Tax=Streptomyces griseus TaxID=1911 RepID=UPI000A368963|nr:hypothetical protein [Streptomyces fimicarius]
MSTGDFYQPGYTYAAIGTDWRFRCDAITTHPGTGDRTAIGWRHFDGEWELYAYDEGDWDVAQMEKAVLGRTAVLSKDGPIAAPPAPADRAAMLREAADAVNNTEFPAEYVDLFDNGARWASMLLRALADEAEYVATPCSFGACEPGGEPCTTHERLMAHAEGDHELCDHEADDAAAGVQPPTTTEAHPPNSSWLVEWREEGGDWVVAYPTHDRSKALNRLSRGREEARDWQWRLVRETRTYTVEPTEQPAAPAAPEEPTCSAGLLPPGDAPVERCVETGRHTEHATATGQRWTDDTEESQ